MKTSPGVIDCLSEGFILVTRFAWVVVLPIALDALLWLAPQITAMPLVEQLLASYHRELALLGDAATATAIGADPQMVDTFGRTFGDTNLLSLLAWNPAGAAVPSFLAGQPVGGVSSLAIASLDSFLVLAFCLQLVGLFLGCVYLGLLGQVARDGRLSLRRLVGGIGRHWLTFLAYVGLLLAFTLVVSFAIAVLGIISLTLAAVLSAVLTTATFFVGLFLLLYMFFFVAAVVVGELGPLDAIRSSFRVVRDNFWSTLGLIILTFLIGQGMLVIWSRLAQETWGMPLAIIGNGFVSSGLVAASMLFYRGRSLRTRAAPAPSVARGGNDSR